MMLRSTHTTRLRTSGAIGHRLLRRHSAETGFSLAELAISMLVLVMMLGAVLTVFQFNTRVARVQTQVADMQQSLRVTQDEMIRLVRMAGRGGIRHDGPNRNDAGRGIAVEVRNNVTGAQRTIATATANSPQAAPNTDILIVRGVFSAPIYQVRTDTDGVGYFILTDGAGNITEDPETASGGQVHICANLAAGFSQSLDPLIGLIDRGVPEALVLVSPLASLAYGVVEFNPGGSSATSGLCDPGNPNAGITLAFSMIGTHANAFRALSPVAPPTRLPRLLSDAAEVAILEEYRYYIREGREIPGDNSSNRTWHLARARMLPGTERAWGDDAATQAANVAVDVADNILDLQVSLGFDTAANGSIRAGDSAEITLTADGAGDDWLYNAVGENGTAPFWNDPAGIGGGVGDFADLYYVNVSTVARTRTLDQGYQAPELDQLLDHVYPDSGLEDMDSDYQRKFRRRVLETIIDLRNL